MTDTWLARVEELLNDALERPTAERAAFVAASCDGDEALRAEVASLLEARAEAFLEEPLIEPQPEVQLLEPGDRCGAFEVQRVLGRGGMGVVYEALQANPRRKVALKVTTRGRSSTRAMQRFEDEAETLVRIDHPDIAHVYESGVEEGRMWLALELVEGAQDVLISSERLGRRERLELLARIARVLHHGHLKGVVHCDVKPANLLVRPDGRPKVIDFGIARIQGEASAGWVAGTPGYMSPEQRAGAVADVRTDVYSLGVVLFQLITGQPPEVAGDPGPGFDHDLRSVVRKALADDVERRYQSALELAQDIDRYLADEPVHSRRTGRLHHLRLFVRRHRGLTASLLALVVVLVAGTVVSLRFAIRAERARKVERVRTYAAMISAADAALRVRDVETARLRLHDAPAEHRGWEWGYLESRLDGSAHTFGGEGLRRIAPTVSPDGRRMLLARSRDGRASELEVRDTTSFALVDGPKEIAGYVMSVLLWDDGSLARMTTSGRLTRVYPGGEVALDVDVGRRAHDLASHDGGAVLVMGNGDGLVRCHDARDGTLLLECGDLSPTSRNCFAVRPGSTDFVHAVADELRVHSLVDGELEAFPARAGLVTALAFDPEGATMAVAREDGTIRLWNYEERKIVSEFGDAGPAPTCVIFLPDGESIAAGYADGALVLWEGGRRGRELWGHSDEIRGLWVLPDERLMSSTFSTAKVWELDEPPDDGLLAQRSALVRDVDYSPDGRRVASICNDSTASVYDLESSALVAEIRHEGAFVRGQTVAFSPDGETLAVGWRTGLELWRYRSGERIPLTPPVVGTLEACWSHDGRLVAAARGEPGGLGDVILYDVASGQALVTLPHPGWVRDLAITPDDERVVCVVYDEQSALWRLYVWALEALEVERIVELPSLSRCMALAPDGRTVATGSDDKQIRLWELDSGRLLRTISGLTVGPWEVSFSPDGKRLACVGRNTMVRIVDAEHGTHLLDLGERAHWFWNAVWRPDGKQIVACAGNYDGVGAEIRLWGD